MGKRKKPAPYVGKDYGGTNFDVTKGFDQQFTNTGHNEDRVNAINRYNAQMGLAGKTMAGAGPNLSADNTALTGTQVKKQKAQGGTMLTASGSNSLFTR
jgi:hypothetical protein